MRFAFEVHLDITVNNGATEIADVRGMALDVSAVALVMVAAKVLLQAIIATLVKEGDGADGAAEIWVRGVAQAVAVRQPRNMLQVIELAGAEDFADRAVIGIRFTHSLCVMV